MCGFDTTCNIIQVTSIYVRWPPVKQDRDTLSFMYVGLQVRYLIILQKKNINNFDVIYVIVYIYNRTQCSLCCYGFCRSLKVIQPLDDHHCFLAPVVSKDTVDINVWSRNLHSHLFDFTRSIMSLSDYIFTQRKNGCIWQSDRYIRSIDCSRTLPRVWVFSTNYCYITLNLIGRNSMLQHLKT